MSAFSHYHDTHPLAVLCVMGPPLDPVYTASRRITCADWLLTSTTLASPCLKKRCTVACIT